MVISFIEIIFICFLLLYCQNCFNKTKFKVLLYLLLQRDKLVYYQGTIKLFHVIIVHYDVMRSEKKCAFVLKDFQPFPLNKNIGFHFNDAIVLVILTCRPYCTLLCHEYFIFPLCNCL